LEIAELSSACLGILVVLRHQIKRPPFSAVVIAARIGFPFFIHFRREVMLCIFKSGNQVAYGIGT